MALSALPEVAPDVLPLQSGDRLTRREFERRYAAMPEKCKAELVEGQVYVMASPLRRAHGEPHAALLHWLVSYAISTPGTSVGDNVTVRLDPDNEVQPDAYLRLEKGGRSRVSQDDYLEGAPELVAEVSASSASYDLHDKLRAYRRNGVQEYLVWRVYDRALDWRVLEDERYLALEPDAHGLLRSRAFPGLHLDAAALLAGEQVRVLEVLHEGLASEAHRRFVEEIGA